MRKNPVELCPAWAWSCDDCGRDNFLRCYESGQDKIRKKLAEHGIELEEAVEEGILFFDTPKTVQCSHCGEWFDVEKPTEEPPITDDELDDEVDD